MPVDGTPLQVQPDAWLKITDAGAKLNIQNLQPNDLARILQNMGIPDQKTRIVEDSLLDWYDKDDLKRLNGAEDYYYRSEIRAAFGPRNSRSPETVAELSLVRGLNDPSIWRQIRPYLVLAPGVMQNINTMGKEMLMALLDISSEVADDLLSLRRSRGFLVLPEVTATAGLRTGLILDNLAAFSSQIIEIEVEAGCGNAREILHCVISFRPDEMTPFTVLEFSY
jgi:general secretion pathway protein K